jgi:predicted ABC-type ATPase
VTDVLLDTRVFDCTELFCEGESAMLKDGLVWKTVCRTGQWKLSPMPGGKPLVIDEELFDDVVAAFDEGAWEHVTVPLSHEDRTDENTGFVEKLMKVADPRRAGQWLLRAGIRFTEPEIKGKVLRGTIANTSVGVSMRGHHRTEDGRFWPRVLKHVALTNRPWLNGLEPFGSEAGAVAASLPDVALAYTYDGASQDTMAVGTDSVHGTDGELVWNIDDEVDTVRSKLSDQLSMYDVRPDGSIGTLDDLDHDGVADAFEQHAAAHQGVEGELMPIADGAYIRGMTWDQVLIGCYPGGPSQDEYAWIAPYAIAADGEPRLSPPSAWKKVERSWQEVQAAMPITYDDWDLEILASLEQARFDGDENLYASLLLDWNPSLHPRWPEHTPGGKGGEFMRISDILKRLDTQPSGTLNVSFLASGADNIRNVVASKGPVVSKEPSVDFAVTLKDGSKHTFNVPNSDRAFDSARVIQALKEIDNPSAKAHGAGDFREGQPRPAIDAFLEGLISEAEADPSMHPPIKKGRVTRELLSQTKPGGRPAPPEGHANTQQMYTTGGEILDKTGEVVGGTWSKDRHALHDAAIAYYLDGKTPPAGKKTALFFAGGTASGKSTALKRAPGLEPENAVHIDPDELKKWIPEYRQAALARDRYASSMAHEESSALAKRLYSEAVRRGLNVIIDGTGDSGGNKFLSKLEAAKKDGYDVSVFMVDAPTEVAVARSVLRGHKTGRFVPLEILRDTHSNVSKAHLTWRNSDVISSWQLWSTADQGGDPVKMADGGAGKTVVHREDLYTEMLGKAGEDVASQAVKGPNVSRAAKASAAGSAVEQAQSMLEQAFADWKSGRAYIDNRGTYRLRAEGQKTGSSRTVAPWSGLVKSLYPDNLDFHKAANGPAPRLQASPIAPGGVALPVPARERTAPEKFKPGARVQFERAGAFKTGVIVGTTPSGGYRVKVGKDVLVAPRSKLFLLSQDKVRIRITDPELLAAFNPALHPRGLKGTHVGGKFIRKLFDAAENGNVIAVNEVAHTVEVGTKSGRKYHIEPAGVNGVRVITYDPSGKAVRTALHALSDIETAYPELKGLTGLIRKKVRGRRGLVGTKGGIKTVIHYGENTLAASQDQNGRGGEHMAGEDNELDTGEGVLELDQDQLKQMLKDAAAEGRKEMELQLSEQRKELRRMRVDKRIRELEGDGHAPAVLKVARQIFLSDETSDEELTLSLDSEDGSREVKTSMSGAIEELLAAIPRRVASPSTSRRSASARTRRRVRAR